MNTKKTITTALVVASLGTAANAAILSVNLTDGGPGMGNSDITETAGVVLAGGWETAAAGGSVNDTNLGALRVDNSGVLTATTATMTIGSGFGGYWNIPGASGFNTTHSNNMMTNFIESGVSTGGTIDFTNLNSAVGSTYDVYIYLNRVYGNTGVIGVDINGGTSKFIEGEANTGPFSEADFASAAAATGAGGNYIHFEGLSANDITINFGAPTGRVGINGIQIVETIPEPSSAALLGLGGLALILRRRK